MNRYIVAAFLALVLSFPVYAMAEDFECTQCCSGTFTLFHGSKELMPLVYWEENGIVKASSWITPLTITRASNGAQVRKEPGTSMEGGQNHEENNCVVG